MSARGGYVIWEGPSAFDGAPIALIATGLRSLGKWSNAKTGDAVQTWILLQGVDPYDALKSGADTSICGACKLRPQGPNGTQRACYVHIGMVHNIWGAYRRGRYRRAPSLDFLEGRVLRVGSYGDPVAVPIEVWRSMIARARSHVGYTHEWAEADPAWRDVVMASCDTETERRFAETDGWRTFRTRFAHEPLAANEVACPASAEGGHRAQCVDCRLCDGSRGEDDRRKSVAIISHGWNAATSAYKRTRLRVLTPEEAAAHELEARAFIAENVRRHLERSGT